MDQGNGDCGDGVHQEVNDVIDEVVNDTGNKARGGRIGEMMEPIPLG